MNASQDNQQGTDSRDKRRLLWPLLVIGALLALSTAVLFVNASKELEPRQIGECYTGKIEELGRMQLQRRISSTKIETTFLLYDGQFSLYTDGKGPNNSTFTLELGLGDTTNAVFQFTFAGEPKSLRGSWTVMSATTQQVAVEFQQVAKLMKLQHRTGLRISGYGGTKDYSAIFPMFSNKLPFYEDLNRQMLAEIRKRESQFNAKAFAHFLDGIRWPTTSQWDYSSEWQIIHASDTLISMLEWTSIHNSEDFIGGMNFVVVNGKAALFQLKDLFNAESNWLQRLSNFCVTNLQQQNASSIIGGQISEFNAKNLTSFTVSPSGVLIYFSRNTVGSNNGSEFNVNVPWEVLRPCLRADGPAKYLTEVKSSGN